MRRHKATMSMISIRDITDTLEIMIRVSRENSLFNASSSEASGSSDSPSSAASSVGRGSASKTGSARKDC